jgi:hypothetical protein
MAKKKNNTGLKIVLTVIITAIVVVAFIIILAFLYTSKDSTIEKILVIEEDYIKNGDTFSVEYGIASPEQVTSIASLERARNGLENSRPILTKMKDNATQIKEIIEESKSDFSGDKLLYLEKVEICYDKRITMMDNFNQILSNEEKYFTYYESISEYDSTYSEFSQLLTAYLAYGNKNDKVNSKKTLGEMKIKISLMRNQLQKANSAVSFPYLNSLIDWTNKYDELIELSLKYYDSSGSEQTKLEKQILDKGVESGKILNDATNRINKDFDDWYVPKISNLRDQSDKDFLSANQVCEDAGKLYGELFP